MIAARRLLLAFATAAVCACGEAPDVAEDRTAAVTGEPQDRARALVREGRDLSRQGHLRQAADLLETATELLAGDPAELAPALNFLSDVYFRLGDYERQEEVLWQALGQAVSIGDRRTAASSWNNLGVSFAVRGRPSAALEAYQQCLELRRGLDDPHGVAATRHNLGVQLLLLGRIDEGVEELHRAVAARRLQGDPIAVGQTLASLAWGFALDGRQQAALEAYAEAVSLLDEGGAVHDLAIALEQRGQLVRTLGRPAEARDDFRRSLELLEASGGVPPLDAAYLRLGLASVDDAGALALLRAAVDTFDALGAQEGRILARLELARALRAGEEEPEEVIAQLQAAIQIVEAARADLRLPSFRATFLGGWQAVYQELVDVLASAGRAERALEVAERARARALLDRMAVAGGETPSSSQSWQELRGRVEELEARTLLAPGDGPGSGSRGSRRQAGEALRHGRFALERAQEIERRSVPPSPAATPAGVDAVRSQLDSDTVLLVYSLAPRRSWLWRLDARGVALLALPPGPQIEALARNVHQLLPVENRPGYGKAARQALVLLSRQVLGPLAGNLGPGRLAVVPDGALYLVPFGALPLPADELTPLAVAYEVVHLPSASTLVALRHRAARAPAPELLAVVADPVFEAGDPRLAGTVAETTVPETAMSEIKGADPPALSRTLGALGGRLSRLPASAEEAAGIAEIARLVTGVLPPVHRGFDANRELVTGGGLGDYRILHFATHGVVDAEDPSLAGLVLSLYDADGRPRDGLLRARDLYDLRLSADLVVLSACRTALGREVRGEGLVGLADGFFAAGANHLVVSLWDVDDRATAELMGRFYRHLLLAGRRPADALRHAQQELREHTEWRSPAHWAAFVAVGDPSPP